MKSCHATHLLHRGIIKQDPLGGLGVEGEGTVVTAGVADHPHELQLTLLGVLVSHPVEELRPQRHGEIDASNSLAVARLWAGEQLFMDNKLS